MVMQYCGKKTRKYKNTDNFAGQKEEDEEEEKYDEEEEKRRKLVRKR